jgi:hypothetical protein
VPEVEVRTIKEADDAGVGVEAGVGICVGVGVGVEFGVDTDVGVVEGVLVEGMEVLLELDFRPVARGELEELGEAEIVVPPPSNTLLKTLAIVPKGFPLELDPKAGGPMMAEVVASFPPNKPDNPSFRTK